MSYRDSYLKKGDRYDDELAGAPLDNYIANVEEKILAKILPKLFPCGINRYLDFAGGTGRITQLIEPFAQESIIELDG